MTTTRRPSQGGEIMACQVCRRILNFKIPEVDGVLVDDSLGWWEHQFADQPADHDPIPVEHASIDTDYRCDFCNANESTWIVPANTFQTLHTQGPGNEAGHHSVGDWSACSVCARHIREDRWVALLRYVIARYAAREPHLDDDAMTRIGQQLANLWAKVRANRTGPIHRDPIAPIRLQEPKPMPDIRFEPADTARLRRELVDWTRESGAFSYSLMMQFGRQLLRPPAPLEQGALILAAEEVARLEAAELFYAGPDVVDLVNAAAPSMPLFAPRAFDFPCESGFILFGKEFSTRELSPEERAIGEIRDMPEGWADDPIRLIAAAWGPWVPAEWGVSFQAHRRHMWVGGGVWVNLYSYPSKVVDDALDALGRSRADRFGGPLTTENEVAVPLLPDELPPGLSEQDYFLPADPSTLGSWIRTLMAVFQLMKQPNIATTTREKVARPERRRHVRANIPEPDGIHLVTLRGRTAIPVDGAPLAAPKGDGTRTLHVRFPVGPFWRNQWYPSLETHRPKLIPLYWKGPADAPIVGAERVRIIAPAGGAE